MEKDTLTCHTGEKHTERGLQRERNLMNSTGSTR